MIHQLLISFFCLCMFALVYSYETKNTAGVCTCTTASCSLLPPSNSTTVWPCYQGTIDDAIKCYKTDPLLQDGTTWECGNCADFGYSIYKQNDPIYKSMELWFVQ